MWCTTVQCGGWCLKWCMMFVCDVWCRLVLAEAVAVWASLQTADRCTSPGPWVWARPRLCEHRSLQPRHNTGTQVGDWLVIIKQQQLFSENCYLKWKYIELWQGHCVLKIFSLMFLFNSFWTLKIFSSISLLYKNKPTITYKNTFIVSSVKIFLKHLLKVKMLPKCYPRRL